VRVELNGEPIELGEEATVAHVVASAGVDGEARGVAVALDGEVVPRGDWPRVALREGQSVEIVSAIQGG
jgi:sulfur carrier protein